MRQSVFVLAPAVAAAVVIAYYGAPIVGGAPRARLLPGETSSGHHQIEASCASCHTPYGGVDNRSCEACHGADLQAASDTHPTRLFTDPRNAERNAGLDARACATCHGEHAPERTRPGGVTVPADFCRACHADVGRERPSHASFTFDGCASVGCHNFHDNRALYRGFLARHLDEPETVKGAALPLRAPRAAAATVRAGGGDVPEGDDVAAAAVRGWERSAHARAGVGCDKCHGAGAATGTADLQARVDHSACAACHASEDQAFLHGAHGMRIAAGLGPMRPALARLPMKPEAAGRELDCSSCHLSHDLDTRRAAVDACLACHDDTHSRAYGASRHALLWQAERGGGAPPGTGVSCATCHLPRGDAGAADHDQSRALRPRDEMVRTVCLRCHGLAFSLDAMADGALVDRNFNGRPAAHVASLDLVRRRLSEDPTTNGGRR